VKKFKGYIISFICGAVIFSATSVFAEPIQQYLLTKISYPILINGAEYTNPDLPVLNYEGNTYVPVKSIGDILGVNVNWNHQLNRVEISTNKDIQPVSGNSPSYGENDAKGQRTSISEYAIGNQPPEEKPTKIEVTFSEFKSVFSIGTIKPGIANDELITTLSYSGNLDSIEFYKWWDPIELETRKKFAEELGQEIQLKNPEYNIAIDFIYQGQRLGYVLAYKEGYQLSSFQNAPPANEIK